MQKAYLNWSGGKDCCLAFHKMKFQNTLLIETLVTTVNSEVNRISMHGVRNSLLAKQAASLDVQLHTIALPGTVSMTEYDKIVSEHMAFFKEREYTHTVFGDIFLEDLRLYREKQLCKVGIQPVFPLWKKETRKLAEEFIALGYKAITVCTNAKYLDNSFCGVLFDLNFLNRLPSTVDPCGENGEFHTFVYDGPTFEKSVSFEIGEKVLRSYQPTEEEDVCGDTNANQNWDNSFWYCDLISR